MAFFFCFSLVLGLSEDKDGSQTRPRPSVLTLGWGPGILFSCFSYFNQALLSCLLGYIFRKLAVLSTLVLMAQNKLISVLVLLLLVFFLEIQCIVGRHLILDKHHNFDKVQTYSRILEKETRTILDHKINGVYIKNAAVANTQSPPSPPTPSGVIGATQAPPPKNEDDFRPTTPGHSPGVGHSIQN
ncbi:hypothetical protein REPUB_Repub09cG0166700 [Reevesia pubescens]